MRLFLFLLLNLFSIKAFTQTNIKGTWSAVTINQGTISLISQEWLIGEDSISINLIKGGSKKNWGVFSYNINDKQINLQSETIDLTFDIKKQNSKRLVIENQDYSIDLKNTLFIPKKPINIPNLKTFKMSNDSEFQCPLCTFLFIENKRKFFLTFEKDSLIRIKEIMRFSDSNDPKSLTQSHSKEDAFLFEQLNESFITGFVNMKIPFELTPKKITSTPITIQELTVNTIVQKGRTKLFQLTNKERKTIFVGKERLKLNADGTGTYHYSMRHELRSVKVLADVEWHLSDNGEFLIVTYANGRGDDVFQSLNTIFCNIYHIRKVNENEWEFNKTLHRYRLD